MSIWIFSGTITSDNTNHNKKKFRRFDGTNNFISRFSDLGSLILVTMETGNSLVMRAWKRKNIILNSIKQEGLVTISHNESRLTNEFLTCVVDK